MRDWVKRSRDYQPLQNITEEDGVGRYAQIKAGRWLPTDTGSYVRLPMESRLSMCCSVCGVSPLCLCLHQPQLQLILLLPLDTGGALNTGLWSP